MNEKSMQSYFMKIIPHGYRISLTTGGGFPDVLVVNQDKHYLVELKFLTLGVKGDKKLFGVFKRTQPPWYMEYLVKGGTNLFVLFQVENRYGLLHVDKGFIRDFPTVKYSDLKKYAYTEYPTLKGLIDDNFS